MNHLTNNRQTELRDLFEQIEKFTKFKYPLTYTEMRELWNNALWYNRRSNRALQDNDPNDVICTIHPVKEKSTEPDGYNIKAHHDLTRKQYFIVLVLERRYATHSEINKALETLK